ncbi:MAG: hypothetical protein NT160_01740 [Actinobacteria bacterium]|nr:hypothetical protein [Actinomycetota bacterium]
MTWEDLQDITAEGKAELKAAGLNANTGKALQALGYTEPGDLRHIADQLQALDLGLEPIQAAKLKKLASGGGAPMRPMSARLQAVKQHRLLDEAKFSSLVRYPNCYTADQLEVKQLCEWNGGISGLVMLLSSPAKGAAHQAAWALLILASDKNNTDKIAAAGAIEALVALLKPGSAWESSTGVLELAAGALGNLARNSEESTAKIAALGGIEALVALLKPGSARALRNLADGSEERRTKIATAGAIEPLVALLKPGSLPWASSQRVLDQAAGALAMLAWNSEERKAKIASAKLAAGVP